MRRTPASALAIHLPPLLFVVLPGTVLAQLQIFQTRYYTIHSDLDRDTIREAALRLTRMVKIYMDRTKGFSGRVTTRLPFYLFRQREDYMAAGGLPGSTGVYTGAKLMAVAGDRVTGRTWRIVQHEGFHQFVHVAMGGDMPVWVDEGLAEYFGQAVFTGDDMIAGLIPPARLQRIKAMIDAHTYIPIAEIMTLDRRAWNDAMKESHYDQAWSMVHFLAHGNSEKYQPKFNGFINDISKKGLGWRRAWRRNFGTDTDAFESAWRAYWQALPGNPSSNDYAKATTSTLTSFLARAVSQKQEFKDFDAFRQAAEEGSLKSHSDDWLPRSLLNHALANARYMGSWTLESKRRKPPTLVCTMDDGTKLIGSYQIRKRRVHSVSVKRTPVTNGED